MEHAEHVLVHEHLAVAARAGADADGGDGQLRRHAFGELGGNGLEDHGEGAGLFHRVGVFQQLAGRIGRLALHLEAAQRVDALGREPDMGAHGDLAVDDGTDAVRHFHTAFQLHGVGARLLHEAAGVHHRVVDAGLIRHEGHIDDDECVLRAAGHSGPVVDHVLHRHRYGVAQTEHDVAERVADEDGINAGLVHEPCRGVVVGGDHRDLLALGLHFEKRRYGNTHGYFLSILSPRAFPGATVSFTGAYYKR